jgi:hypothetical protein
MGKIYYDKMDHMSSVMVSMLTLSVVACELLPKPG